MQINSSWIEHGGPAVFDRYLQLTPLMMCCSSSALSVWSILISHTFLVECGSQCASSGCQLYFTCTWLPWYLHLASLKWCGACTWWGGGQLSFTGTCHWLPDDVLRLLFIIGGAPSFTVTCRWLPDDMLWRLYIIRGSPVFHRYLQLAPLMTCYSTSASSGGQLSFTGTCSWLPWWHAEAPVHQGGQLFFYRYLQLAPLTCCGTCTPSGGAQLSEPIRQIWPFKEVTNEASGVQQRHGGSLLDVKVCIWGLPITKVRGHKLNEGGVEFLFRIGNDVYRLDWKWHVYGILNNWLMKHSVY